MRWGSSTVALKVVVVELDRLFAERKLSAMFVFPDASFAQTDAHYWVCIVAGDEPLLVALVRTVSGKAANIEFQFGAVVTLGIHLAHFNGLVANYLNDLKWVDVAVAVVVCKFAHFSIPSLLDDSPLLSLV